MFATGSALNHRSVRPGECVTWAGRTRARRNRQRPLVVPWSSCIGPPLRCHGPRRCERRRASLSRTATVTSRQSVHALKRNAALRAQAARCAPVSRHGGQAGLPRLQNVQRARTGRGQDHLRIPALSDTPVWLDHAESAWLGGSRCPQRDSNPRQLERAVTWAASRWGPASRVLRARGAAEVSSPRTAAPRSFPSGRSGEPLRSRRHRQGCRSR